MYPIHGPIIYMRQVKHSSHTQCKVTEKDKYITCQSATSTSTGNRESVRGPVSKRAQKSTFRLASVLLTFLGFKSMIN